MKQINNNYKVAASIHNSLARAERFLMIIAAVITFVKIGAAIVMSKTRKK